MLEFFYFSIFFPCDLSEMRLKVIAWLPEMVKSNPTCKIVFDIQLKTKYRS